MNTSKKSQSTQNKVLDAALRCYERDGLNHVNMQEIAAEASIGRTTLYRHFSNQEEVLAQVARRDILKMVDSIQACLDQQNCLEDKIVEGLMFCIDSFSNSPVLSLLLQPESVNLLIELGINTEAMNQTGAELTHPIYAEAQQSGRLRSNISLTDFVEWVTRILISFQASPGKFQNKPDALREFLHKLLVPSLLNT